MITIGVDAHKRVHVALALDAAGRKLGSWQGPNSPLGWYELQVWSVGLGEERQWGIEGAWSYGRGLAQQLVAQGETVYEINSRWTAAGRRGARRSGKTDRLDAAAVAAFVRQEAPGLPQVFAGDTTALLDQLTTEREATLREVRRLKNQVHALLMQLDPLYRRWLPNLKSKAAFERLKHYATEHADIVQAERAAAVRRLAARMSLAQSQADELSDRIRDLAREHFAPLTEVCGINLLTAGTLAGILGPGRRFKSDAEVAAYAGVSPIEASSAGVIRHRLNRGGNRQLNHVVHLIAWTQSRSWPPAQAYLERRSSEGKSRREAVRAMKRFIIRAVWQRWQECLALGEQKASATAA